MGWSRTVERSKATRHGRARHAVKGKLKPSCFQTSGVIRNPTPSRFPDLKRSLTCNLRAERVRWAAHQRQLAGFSCLTPTPEAVMVRITGWTVATVQGAMEI
ncbi:Ankyrin Repeat Domain-Containing Protein 26 [Manis pentadactyla]|nr:Ankyrin Repeat Domain-Containing Protein 26 [Manis pentadactyla]